MLQLPKQIVETDIPYDPNNSEAYVYKHINLSKNNKTYGGKRLGKPDGSYICSSSSEEFKADFMNPNYKWRFEVITYGTEQYCLAVENRMLLDNNAADSDDWYNKHNGGSTLNIPRVNLIKAIAKEITETKSYKGVKCTYIKVKDIPTTRLQIREFTYDKEHIITLRNIINTTHSLEHLIWVSVKNRTYRGQKGELGIDGNHSIEAALISDFGAEGMIPSLRLDNLPADFTDDEIDLLAMYLNPRVKNPKLPTDIPTIARRVANLLMQGLDTNSKEIQQIYHDFHLTVAEKGKTSKIAREMKEEMNPSNELTWINYGAGDEKRKIQSIILDEQLTNDNKTGIWSKCYSTAKFSAWADIHDIMNWNRENPHNKVHTYKIRFYHADKDYEQKWINELQKKNIIAIEDVFNPHNIKREWVFLDPQRNKLTRGGI